MQKTSAASFSFTKYATLFFGKSGAILLGYSDTTQDVDLYVEKDPENCRKLVPALLELRFSLTELPQEEIRQGKDFVQFRNGPFDLDLIFAPDGIDRFEDAWQRHVEKDGFPVADIDDIKVNGRPIVREIGKPFPDSCVSGNG